jgi:hypothetical protein
MSDIFAQEAAAGEHTAWVFPDKVRLAAAAQTITPYIEKKTAKDCASYPEIPTPPRREKI